MRLESLLKGKKVLVLGKNGMLGSAFMDFCEKEGVEVLGWSREDVDILDFQKFEGMMEEVKADYVINCTAYTNVDKAEEQEKLAMKVNYEAVENMAKVCSRLRSVLMHFSTDYVFDGENEDGYGEGDEAGALNVYGKSKWLGEEAVRGICEKYYIVRTSWLFGPNGRNFVSTMVSLAERGIDLKIISDQVGSPTYTIDLVKHCMEGLIGEGAGFGTYHLTNSGSCSWYEFAGKIFELRGLEVNYQPTSSEEYGAKAKRPKCSILKNGKCEKMRGWDEAVKEYLDLPFWSK